MKLNCKECERKKDADFGFDGFKIVTNILSDDHLKLHWDSTDLDEMDRIPQLINQQQIRNNSYKIQKPSCP